MSAARPASAPRPLRIAVIAPLRFPIRHPHAGGLESAVWSEVSALTRRGHEVTLVGVRGSDFVEPGSVFEMPRLAWEEGASPTDKTYPASYEAVSVPALDRALDEIQAHPERYDVISNHCLHALPLRRAATLGVPMVTTLHTPVDAQFLAANARGGPGGSTFLAVSAHTQREWAAAGVESDLLPNGVDPASWPEGPGGDDLVWFGRLVPEKAPHLAIEVARLLGRRLVIAGRSGDDEYAETEVYPLLGDDVLHVGALNPSDLAELVGRSAVALATPVWDEPFGLVAPEALMCGTPAVSFAVGGVPEVAAGSVGMRVAPPRDVATMAAQVEELISQTRSEPGFRARVRASAVRRFSLESRLSLFEERLHELVARYDARDEDEPAASLAS